ncbi:conserved hypothetical protein [Talaromyces stipitatus ATCC 10500]|uniref:AHC1-like C2H2 zinc-finger domain-containing protein n=1 Tax=Talaromyces stipitatus (strain ATCC 10500 / CBS 375.48 / QM 6759 / NRRL 1006) TaxID=441959 RepID=B8LVG0_TALSN|nr:uncharacterized protein TSTA_073670 [Talaromyces stipitatus ATCC 10500]EED23979.1 conserved hypothetical protein [Talaromyces stipitatus ATCC 10500]
MALSHGVFRLLPWTSSLGVNKIAPEMLVSTAPHKSPAMGSAPLQLLKRKRTDNHEIFTVIDEPHAKRRLESSNQLPLTELNGINTASLPTPPSHDEASPDSASSAPIKTSIEPMSTSSQSDIHEKENPSKAAATIDMNALRQSLDAQLSLEVLLKHNELRLIDQEIAKCQVALEQLRRCAEIPYPGSSVQGLSQAVSDGSGHAVPYSGTGPPPVSPAPWGVADGPYSRHYSKWLLPDPRFDGGESPDLPPTPNTASESSRYTRGTFTENGYVAGKSRAQRGSMSTRLQSLPNGYPVVKEKAGPMVIKRKSDNKQVKLVCLDCRRFDFSSTQGFINHCRIAHSRTFASHDAAAEACGEPVDVDEAGAIIGGGGGGSGGGTTPNEPPIVSNPGSVHPLVRTAHTVTPTPLPIATPVSKVAKPKKNHTRTPSSPFKASPATPHLSCLLSDLGSKLNLDEIVADAKTPVDLSEFMSEGESDDEGDSEGTKVSPGARLPARTTMPQASASQRPTSSKRHETSQALDSTPSKVSASVQYPQAFLPSALQLEESGGLIHMDDNLSPVTVESHQAPSLVSDNEDDEYGAASDSDNFSSRSSDDGHDDDEDDDDIEVEDDEASTTSKKTTHEVTTFKRSQEKKRERVLPPAIVSLNPGGKRQNPPKSKKAGNPKKGN